MFDPNKYPDRVACVALPALEEGSLDVEVTDWDENVVLLEVPSDAVQRNKLPPRAIDQARAGLSFIACQVKNRNEGLVFIEVPTTAGSHPVVVPLYKIVKVRKPTFCD